MLYKLIRQNDTFGFDSLTKWLLLLLLPTELKQNDRKY